MLVQNVYDTSVVNTSQNPKKEKRFLCNVCCKQFQHKGNLNSHMRSHTGERPYSCDVCEKRFSTSGILKTHMRTHTGEKPYLCDTCGKRFSHIGILKNHMLTHSGERPHRCPIPDCGKDYSRAANLKIHMRSHTGERPFRCEYPKCDWTFVSNADLKVHMRTHSGVKSFTCNVDNCKKEFLYNQDLKNHILSHKEIDMSITKDCTFTRPQIIKTVPDKATSYEWISLESEYKKLDTFGDCQKSQPGPYSCSICSKAFSTLPKLKQHIKEHETVSETRPYKCTDCSRKFSQPRNIHRHMVLCHGKPETTGPFTLALMSPERTPFTDKNSQTSRKRPLDELHKSAFTPVAKSPNTSPDGKVTPPTKRTATANPTKLFITNVKSLREDNPFPDITPLDSPVSGNLKIKEEKKSPRHHPYAKPSPIKTRQVPRLAPKPPQYAIVQTVNLPTLQAFKVESQSTTPPPPATTPPAAVSRAQPSPPARIHTPETLHSITMVDQIRYAAVMTSFDHMVRGYLAHRTYQTLKCFYKCLTTAKQSVELGREQW